MTMRFAATAFAVFLVMAPSFADDPAAQASEQPKIDSHLAAAMDVLEATNAKNNFTAIVGTMTETMLGAVKKDHPGADEKTQKAFIDEFKTEIGAELPELLKMQAAVYAEHFSEADLKALAAFYRSDVGKRYIAELPALMKEVMPIAFKWGQAAGMKAMEKTMEKLKKEGMKL